MTQSDWSHDLDQIGDRPVEVAFDNCLGFCNVRICQQKRQWHGVRHAGGILVVGYYQEDSSVDLSAGTGWRPYAWRDIPVPPPLSP